MAIIIGDLYDVILIEYLEHGHTVTADSYCAIFTRLCDAIQRQRPGILSDGVIILYDNASPHTARQTQELLQKASAKSKVTPHTVQI